MSLLVLLLLPVAIFSGWFFSNQRKEPELRDFKKTTILPRDYLIGLQFLFEEQTDKALDLFIKMLQVDSDTVETHLALGGLFRRRGEVDRAIRIHQNLIARPNLSPQQRTTSLLALGQDYLKAGMLDRAERVFLEVSESGLETTSSLKFLREIYQREKSWNEAIQVSRKLQSISGEDLNNSISHYYCELGLALMNEQPKIAEDHFFTALQIDKNNVRASFLLGQLAEKNLDYKSAIKSYKQIKNQDADFLSEALYPLANCYEQLQDIQTFIRFLKECLKEHARISVVLILSDFVMREYGHQAAADLIVEYLQTHPSLKGLNRLIELQQNTVAGTNYQNLHLLRDIIQRMLANKPVYRCVECGFGSKTIVWLCPGCRTWSTIKPIHGLEGD